MRAIKVCITILVTALFLSGCSSINTTKEIIKSNQTATEPTEGCQEIVNQIMQYEACIAAAMDLAETHNCSSTHSLPESSKPAEKCQKSYEDYVQLRSCIDEKRDYAQLESCY